MTTRDSKNISPKVVIRAKSKNYSLTIRKPLKKSEIENIFKSIKSENKKPVQF